MFYNITYILLNPVRDRFPRQARDKLSKGEDFR